MGSLWKAVFPSLMLAIEVLVRQEVRKARTRLDPHVHKLERPEDGLQHGCPLGEPAGQQQSTAVRKLLRSFFCLPNLARLSLVAHPNRKCVGKGIL